MKMTQRSQAVLERFGQISVAGVNLPELLSILSEVKAYWKDNFRPALISFSCQAVGGQTNVADDASLMVTLMGAGLGIHDDIIDRSFSKHFRMTVLGSHGVDDALLIGELFIVKSLLTVKEMIRKDFSIQTIGKILEIFENFFMEIWEGEFLETRCRRNLDTELKEYEKVLWMSTADTEACARIGAMLGGGSRAEIETLAEVGRRLGYIFRLGDELKDTLNLENNLQNRLEDESVPLPILFAAKSSQEIYNRIKNILAKPKVDSSDVLNLLKICLEVDSFTYVLNLAKANEVEALSKLDLLENNDSKEALALLVKNTFEKIEALCHRM